MHGFAINVHTDLEYMTNNIVPCGIAEYPVTSVAAEGIDITMKQMVDVGFDPVTGPNTPEAWGALVAGEVTKWSAIVKQAGLKAE
jgi:hypothetical protein